MPSFSKRNINRRSLQIFKSTGKVIACYQRLDSPTDSESVTRVPASLFTANVTPAESPSSVRKYFIFAKFENQNIENQSPEGRTGQINGNITIPYIYRAIVNLTDYFDPYLNGSRFVKVGSAIDDEDLFIVQSVRAEYLPQIGQIV